MQESSGDGLYADDGPKMQLPPGGFKLPSMEQFMEMLDKMKDMSPEQKEELKKDLLSRAANRVTEADRSLAQYSVFILMISIIVLVFGRATNKMEDPISFAQSSKVLTSLLENKNSRQMALRIVEQLKELSETFHKLSDDEKKIYSDEMKNKFHESLNDLNEVFNQKSHVPPFDSVFIIIFISCCVFFGYKLYKSLVEKERKREEKQKAKQMKKKK